MRTRCPANIPASPTRPSSQRSTVQGGNTILLRGGTDYALLNSVVIGTNQLPRHRRDRRHHHPRRRRAAAGSRRRRSSARSCWPAPTRSPMTATSRAPRSQTIFGIGHQQQQFDAFTPIADQRVHQRRQRGRGRRDRSDRVQRRHLRRRRPAQRGGAEPAHRRHLYRRGPGCGRHLVLRAGPAIRAM